MKPQAIGPVMIDIDGLSLTAADREKIAHPNTGALILFARNFDHPAQVEALIADIRKARSGDILIAVDQEGGRVQRFQNGFTRLPAAAKYADKPELAEAAGWLMAAELLAIDVDFSFAPVLDVDRGVSEIIGNRSFSGDPTLAAQLAGAFRTGMRAAGMAATGKHFPGHGAVALDSHLTLPIDDRDLASIRAEDLVPFNALIEQGLEAVMPAHVVYPRIDRLPAGFSGVWLQDILRGELGFNGAIFSDDLSMNGAAGIGDYTDRARLALEAGCDMVLVCNNSAAAEQVLDDLPVRERRAGEARLQAMRGQPKFTREQLQQLPKWQQISKQLQELYESPA
ncbi:beta-N-acetylhexosaminidase [Methylomonas sp. MED-D]|uniref:beta-N-acetylhexosaminidase n=1 Tax=unclassified Methylomonas TaxID=2608980 RepID=UPI0028A503C1|nr:beta-N-acetylhexosaminidase [Methylomonas sp. MV1]MDT4331698.1 beta-N-acetylhexosaminidase [Methylomonas sp. MV1]